VRNDVRLDSLPATTTEVPMRLIGLAVVLTLGLLATPLATRAQAQSITCASYLIGPEDQRQVFVYGYLEGVQAALTKYEMGDMLVPPSHPDHPIWWVLPALPGNPVYTLTARLDAQCRAPSNERQDILDAILALSERKEGWPKIGISDRKRKPHDPWYEFLGPDTAFRCSVYLKSPDYIQQGLVYGYSLGTGAFRARFKRSIESGLSWPRYLSTKANPRGAVDTVMAAVSKNCRQDSDGQDATVRDVLWLVTAELGVKDPAKGKENQ
jgi:hypothetical protein